MVRFRHSVNLQQSQAQGETFSRIIGGAYDVRKGDDDDRTITSLFVPAWLQHHVARSLGLDRCTHYIDETEDRVEMS
jgi:hypothetical protein